MKNKKQIVIATSVLVLVTILLLGLTYAYYKTRINGNTKDKSISVTSKKLEITYGDGNGVISPTEKIEPGYTVTKTFTVENTGDQTLSYSIKLDNITNTFSRTEDWTYVLKKGDVEVSSGVLPTNETYIVNVVSIDSKVTDSYSLTVTYANLTDVDQSLDMGKELSLRVNIDEAVGTIFESASEGTLLKAIGNDNLISKPLTIPGVEPSSENEAVLAGTEDNYGTSYYFRGNVKNNFVNFSGMCFRVVRVQGDGSIKITLADRDHECNSSDYNRSLADSAFISADRYSYKNNPERKNNDFSFNASDALSYVNSWFYEKSIDETKAISSYYCDSVSLTSKKYYDIDRQIVDDITKATYFSYFFGLNRDDNKNPTLKCDYSTDFYNDNVDLVIYLSYGMLSADEVVFAGGTLEQNNSNYYLQDNANDDYWTMSPASLEYIHKEDETGSYETAIIFGVGSSMLGHFYYDGRARIRPVLVLSSEVEITSGDGTQSNPYVVQ